MGSRKLPRPGYCVRDTHEQPIRHGEPGTVCCDLDIGNEIERASTRESAIGSRHSGRRLDGIARATIEPREDDLGSNA